MTILKLIKSVRFLGILPPCAKPGLAVATAVDYLWTWQMDKQAYTWASLQHFLRKAKNVDVEIDYTKIYGVDMFSSLRHLIFLTQLIKIRI